MSDTPSQPVRRRRRRRATAAQGPPLPSADASLPLASELQPVTPHPPAARAADPVADAAKRRRAQRDPGGHGLRDLVGSGQSQVGVDAALRARDVNRPSEEDLAAAEREVVIVRRNWRPDAR